MTSLTSILSIVGLRTIFPLMVPSYLWERANAIDANGYVVATILGPPIAASLVAFLGAPEAMIAIAIPFGLAALALIGLREPVTATVTSGRLLRDAYDGLRYSWSNRTIRGLGFSMSVINLCWGAVTIILPLIVLDVLDEGEAWVGIAFAASGISGMISALVFGQRDTRGRELPMLVIPMILMGPAVALMLPATGVFGPIEPAVGLALVVVLDVRVRAAERAARHRPVHDPPATDGSAWMGRAFAVSMAFNFMGYPFGAIIAGALASDSLPAAVLLGVVTCVPGRRHRPVAGPAAVPRTWPGRTSAPAT